MILELLQQECLIDLVPWKEKRRQFQLMTRCMTSMLERIIPRITTKDCWKILIECVEKPSGNDCINLLLKLRTLKCAYAP